ncbi:MAG TPA: aspartate-semialdehyde dehydrogenase [Longimicrobiales bacterium]
MRVAILGATGAVGRTMLRVLEEREVPIDEIVPLASERSVGTRLTWRGREWRVRVPEPGVFRGCDVALFSAGAERSREWAPRAAEEGAVVVDNSSAWRMHPEVPLVVPEVNARRIAERPLGIIANPNCVTIQLVLALEAIRRVAGLARVVASTYQSVSGAGQKGVAALEAELAGRTAESSPFGAAIAGNVIPSIGPRDGDGWNEEEEKIRQESRKILEQPGLPVAATCVRVPVVVGHAVAATVETQRPVMRDEVERALSEMPGVRLAEVGRDPLPCDAAGADCVFVGRVRLDRDVPRTLHLWVVADNLRKGAATNAIQIAEHVIRG